MGGKVSLPVAVEIAFGANALATGALTWTDVSAYVSTTRTIEASRGTDPETGEPAAGRLTFQLNNESGNFTPGKTGAFGLIRNRLPIRLKQGSTVIWTGLVETWRVSWTNGVRSVVDVTCVDRWAAIRRLRIAADPYWKVVESQAPAAYWPLRDSAEPARPSTASTPDLSPWQYSTSFSPTSPTWNTTTPPPWVTDSAARTVYLTGGGTVAALGTKAASLGTTTEVSISAWVQLAAVSPSISAPIVIVGSNPHDVPGAFPRPNSISLDYNTNSSQLFTVASTYVYDNALSGINQVSCSGATYTERSGTWVHLAVTLKVTAGSGVVKTYINGAPNGTVTRATGATFAVSPNVWLVGVGAAGTSIFGLCVWNRELTATEIATQAANFMSWTGDKADVRAGRIAALSESSPITLTTSGTFASTMSVQDLVDKSVADALLECATAERGTIYVGTDGWPVMASRSWRTGAALAFTIPARALEREVSWTLDDQQLVNSATVDRMVRDETAATVKVKNATSVTSYGEQSRQVSIYVDTDAQLLERANGEANMWAAPLPRSTELAVDLVTKGTTVAVTPNLLSVNQSSVETDTTGLVVANACTIARSTLQAYIGTASLLLTATATNPVAGTSTGTSGIPVTPGQTYTAHAALRAGLADGRSADLYLAWYTAAGTFISYAGGTGVTGFSISNTSWVTVTRTGVAPSNAAFAAVQAGSNDAVTSETLYVDALGLWVGPSTVWRAPGASLLEANIGQRVAVSGMPAQAPTQTQFFIEAIADRITEKGWVRTFTVSPRLDYFTVENSTFGAIDSTNVLAF